MRNRWIIFLLCGLSLLAIIYIFKSDSTTTINYFPIDEKTNFQYAKTELKASIENDRLNDLTWISESKSIRPLYLRQDLSLLYDNGKLRGARSKWMENTDLIDFKELVPIKENSFFQAISYHHGEIHYPNDVIKSIQLMSESHLYIVYQNFLPQNNNKDNMLKKELNNKTKRQLLRHWNELINHFGINTENYLSVPLTELYKYNNETILSLNTNQTEKIIGQLWEGMYKNYIIPITNTNSSQNNYANYVPLVLFEKENTHLLILFDLNGKKEKLIQRYAN